MNLKKLTEHPHFKIYKRFFPLGAFLGGFVWDAVTIGRVVTEVDLWILTLYFVGATLFLRLLTAPHPHRWRSKFLWLYQFTQGALFSALSIFYFKSTGAWYNVLVLLMVFTLLIANEFFLEKWNRRWLWVAMHQIAGTMLFSFLLPHWFHSVSWGWILLASVSGFAFSAFVSHWGRSRKQGVLGLGAACFMAAWFFNLVPPVPLVLKESFACKEREASYLCKVPQLNWWQSLSRWTDDPKLPLNKGETLVYMSSIFAPNRVEAKLEHRWYIETQGKWQATDVIPLLLRRGGREEGWRFYSEKKYWQLGNYKVETALKDGPVISQSFFQVVQPQGDEQWKVRQLP